MRKKIYKYRSDESLLCKIYKELLKPTNRKTNDPIKKGARDLNRHLTREASQIASKHMKDAPHHMPSGKHILQ